VQVAASSAEDVIAKERIDDRVHFEPAAHAVDVYVSD